MNRLVRTCDRNTQTTKRRPDGRSVEDLGGDPRDFYRSLGSPSQLRETDRQGDRVAELVAIVVLAPQGAREPLRSAFTEALTNKVGVSWIRAAKPETKYLFNDAADNVRCDQAPPCLQIVNPLDDAIEPLGFDSRDGWGATSSHFSPADGRTELPVSSRPTSSTHFPRSERPRGRGQSRP
ncbi:hypothetical protein E1289_17555 [Actinomadura sp. 6K520]|nr:hypothetical protein E1289_17555 [Actinomadura sp. 6K520]